MAQSSWGNAPARWCVVHSRFISGDTAVVWVAGKYFASQGTLDDGPYTSLITSSALTATLRSRRARVLARPTVPVATW
jgi:hypothetical protein